MEGEFIVIRHLVLSTLLVSSVSAWVPPPVAAVEEPATVVVPSPSTAPGDGLPYGPFSPDPSDLGSRFTGGWIPLSPSYALTSLGQAQDAGVSVAARLSGGRDHFKNSDGTFSLALWKDRIDNWEHTNIDEFINDGTILVHFLIDEPKCAECWGGQVVKNNVLDEMAAYSKERWPSMATAVRVSPTWLADHAGGLHVAWPNWEWTYLDTAWTQYSARKGDVVEHAIAENASAIEQDLGLIVGLNVLIGGDGSSGLSYPYHTEAWTMSTGELSTYTKALIDNTSSCAFIMWSYDFGGFTYFERPEIHQTIEQLATYADGSPQGPCSRRQAATPTFYDLAVTVFEDDILWLARQGITTGCNPPANNRFCPDEAVTRGQMASFLARALGLTAGAGSDLFRDDDGNVHEHDIDRLGTAGVTMGCSPPVNDRFCPDEAVTRGQMAAFLVRALGLTNDGGGNGFVDDDGSMFEDDIAKIAAAGITTGCNPPANDRFCPDEAVTRGQMAAFLRRALT